MRYEHLELFPLNEGALAAIRLKRERAAVIDDQGTRTFAVLDRRTSELSTVMADLGIDAYESIGPLAHNQADMVETMIAAGKLVAARCAQTTRQASGVSPIEYLARHPRVIYFPHAQHDGPGHALLSNPILCCRDGQIDQ